MWNPLKPFPHHKLYMSLLRQYARMTRLERWLSTEERVRKTRVGCLVLQLQRRLYGGIGT